MATTFNDATPTTDGSRMTAASILEVILRRIQPFSAQVTSITEELLNTLLDITGRDDVDFLQTTSAPTITEGTASIAKPTGFKRFIQLELAEVGILPRISIDQYQNSINNDVDYTGEPRVYAEYGNQIYIYPTSDDDYTATLTYAYTHPYSTYSILLDNGLREAVYNGVIYRLFAGRLAGTEGAGERIVLHTQLYEKELATQADRFRNRQPRRVAYRRV